MNKICTTIEQSKKLIELGVDVNTADMVYLRAYLGEERDYILLIGSYPEEYTEKGDGSLIPVYDEHIPAWSLTALLSLSNSCDLSKERIEEDGSDDRYWFHDDNFHKFSNEYDNPLDAVFEMVCWLKENNKI